MGCAVGLPRQGGLLERGGAPLRPHGLPLIPPSQCAGGQQYSGSRPRDQPVRYAAPFSKSLPQPPLPAISSLIPPLLFILRHLLCALYQHLPHPPLVAASSAPPPLKPPLPQTHALACLSRPVNLPRSRGGRLVPEVALRPCTVFPAGEVVGWCQGWPRDPARSIATSVIFCRSYPEISC